MRPRGVLFGLILLMASASACGGGDSKTAIVRDFAQPGASEIENYNSVDLMLKAADRLVIGQVTEVVYGPDTGLETKFKTARVSVKDELTGGVVEVGFTLSPVESAEVTMAELKSALPTGRSVWVLRSVERFFPGVFKPTTRASIIEADNDGFARPAFYRASAGRVRNGGEADDHAALLKDMTARSFDSVVAAAAAPK